MLINKSTTQAMDANVIAVNRYLGVIAIAALVVFTTWWSSEMTNVVYFFLSGYTAYLIFVAMKSWSDEGKQVFNRVGPTDTVLARRGGGGAR